MANKGFQTFVFFSLDFLTFLPKTSLKLMLYTFPKLPAENQMYVVFHFSIILKLLKLKSVALALLPILQLIG